VSVANEHRWGLVGLVGFGVALAVHVLTIRGVDVSSRFPYIWAMHAVVLLYYVSLFLLIPEVFQYGRHFNIWLDNLPGWALLGNGILLAYAAVNFVVCLHLMGGGGADIVNGEHVLTSHGQVLAQLTEAQYHVKRAYQQRMFSGGWVAFWLVAANCFLFWRHEPVRSTSRLLA
jgi:hypothetical protein